MYEIKIVGTLVGNIWMPYEEYTKEFSVRFSPNEHQPFTSHWTGLRDAFLEITNDGDFSSCKVQEAYITVTYWDMSSKRNNVMSRTINAEIVPGKSLEDMFV
jgi:hypothetical protein